MTGNEVAKKAIETLLEAWEDAKDLHMAEANEYLALPEWLEDTMALAQRACELWELE
jgi:hypothetical protein